MALHLVSVGKHWYTLLHFVCVFACRGHYRVDSPGVQIPNRNALPSSAFEREPAAGYQPTLPVPKAVERKLKLNWFKMSPKAVLGCWLRRRNE